MSKQLKVEFNESYKLPEFNKKWFNTISKEDYQNKLNNSAVSGKPTKVWKDVVKRFFANKWNLFFLLIVLIIMFLLIFGSLFTDYSDHAKVKDIDRSKVQFLKPYWNRIPEEYTGRLSDIQAKLDTTVSVQGTGAAAHLVWPGGNIVSSSWDPTPGMWTIKFEDPNYIATALGTDSSGVSVYSRLISSARFSIGLAVLVATVESILGTVVGMYLGYNAGKAIDTYFMRVIEMIRAIPALLIVIVMVLVLGSGFGTLFLSLIIIGWVGPIGIARMFTIKIKDSEFIKASISIGASSHTIIFKHIFPNIIGRVLVSFVNRIPGVIFTEAVLVFLGIQIGGEMHNSLGNMFQEARTVQSINENPWFLASSAATLALFTLSMQIMSNGLRDAFDAKISG